MSATDTRAARCAQRSQARSRDHFFGALKHSGLLLLLVACAHNVPQDKATGPDGKVKAAVPIVLENGGGKARGIVTYPGGDRIDWKSIELPQGSKGTLELELTWRTPRPGLQVAFDVFDQWNTPIVATKAPQRKGGRIRSVTINEAQGKYFVRVYAPKRGDAGQYTLSASYVEIKDDGIDVRTVPIPDPPKLAAVPPPDPICEPFDVHNKACEKECPEIGAPKGWPGCKKQESDTAAAEAAKQAATAREQCLKNAPKAVVAQIKFVEGAGDVVKAKIAVGTNRQPIDTSWSGEVLGGPDGTGKPLQGGSVRIIGVDKQFTRGEIHLTTDQLATNPWVRLSPPPTACP
jgi:hypothetical protein